MLPVLIETQHEQVMWPGWQFPAWMIATALALQPSICGAQSNIGSAASVRNQVEGILGGQTQSLSSGSAVHSNELIRSGEGAVANLVFIDQTKLSVGPKSEVRLDKFVYDQGKQSGAVVVRVSRGAYRFVTGVQDSKNYEIKTPYATLGVRGTVLEMNLKSVGQARADGSARPLVLADGSERGLVLKAPARERDSRDNVKVRLVESTFQARSISGKTATITDPNTVLTICSDGSFQISQSNDSILDFNPEFAELPGPEWAAILAAAGLISVITGQGGKTEPIQPPASNH